MRQDLFQFIVCYRETYERKGIFFEASNSVKRPALLLKIINGAGYEFFLKLNRNVSSKEALDDMFFEMVIPQVAYNNAKCFCRW